VWITESRRFDNKRRLLQFPIRRNSDLALPKNCAIHSSTKSAHSLLLEGIAQFPSHGFRESAQVLNSSAITNRENPETTALPRLARLLLISAQRPNKEDIMKRMITIVVVVIWVALVGLGWAEFPPIPANAVTFNDPGHGSLAYFWAQGGRLYERIDDSIGRLEKIPHGKQRRSEFLNGHFSSLQSGTIVEDSKLGLAHNVPFDSSPMMDT
jgi:hypothetical protein